MDDTYSVIITKKGQQIPVKTPANVSVRLYMSNDSAVEQINLDVDQTEFEHLQKLAVTNSIPDAILKEKGHANVPEEDNV